MSRFHRKSPHLAPDTAQQPLGFREQVDENSHFFYHYLMKRLSLLPVWAILGGSFVCACAGQQEAEAPNAGAPDQFAYKTSEQKSLESDETLSVIVVESKGSAPPVMPGSRVDEEPRAEYYVVKAAGDAPGDVTIAQAADEAPADAPLLGKGIDIRVSNENELASSSRLDILSNSQEAQQYTAALEKLEAADFQGARSDFARFEREHPKHWLAGSALYWQGVAERALGEVAAAQVTLAQMLQHYPKSTRCSDASLELAHVYYSQGNQVEARRLYHLVLRKYPKTPAAQAVPTEYLSSFKK